MIIAAKYGDDPAAKFLSEAELAGLIGAKIPSKQLAWLHANGWVYITNAAGRPAVGQIYARLKLSGVNPTSSAVMTEPWRLDLDKVS